MIAGHWHAVDTLIGRPPCLDVGLLGVGVALARSSNQRGIDDLPRHWNVAGLAQHPVDAFEQRRDRAYLRQPFPEQPDRLGIGHTIRQAKPEEAHEGKGVVDQVLGALVRQRVDRLDHQYLEHQHRIEGRVTATSAIAIGKCFLRFRAE